MPGTGEAPESFGDWMRRMSAEEARLRDKYAGVVIPEDMTDWYVTCEYQISPQVRAYRLVDEKEDPNGYMSKEIMGDSWFHCPYFKYRRLDLEAWEHGETIWGEERGTMELMS